MPRRSARDSAKAIRGGKYDVIVVNFANGDMVGHTGIEAAAIKAVEAVDECVGKVVEAIKEVNGQLFICADHGNCEKMVDEKRPANPSRLNQRIRYLSFLVNADPKWKLKEGGRLCDIVPTMIQLMGMEKPAEMTGCHCWRRNKSAETTVCRCRKLILSGRNYFWLEY